MAQISVDEKAHSLLGASSSHRWLHCTPSAVAESAEPDTASEFAREGTLAHALCARGLKTALGMDHKEEDAEIEALSEEFLTGEMQEYADGYISFVLSRYAEAKEAAKRRGTAEPEIRIEQYLDYSTYVPEGFGTGDAIIAGGDYLEVIDFKYGRNIVVDPRENPQMKLYALGALGLYDYAYDFGEVRLTIYQPRVGNISSWITNTQDLLYWGEGEVRYLASLAHKGLGRRQAGEWCFFCKVKGKCAELARYSLGMAEMFGNTEELSLEDLGGILGKLKTVKDWVKAVEDRSLLLAMGGTEIPGYKLVAGRSIRKITDPARLAAELRAAFSASDEDIFRPQELKTLTDLERAFGKRFFERMLGVCIEKPAGAPALVPDSDKRPALNALESFGDIK